MRALSRGVSVLCARRPRRRGRMCLRGVRVGVRGRRRKEGRVGGRRGRLRMSRRANRWGAVSVIFIYQWAEGHTNSVAASSVYLSITSCRSTAIPSLSLSLTSPTALSAYLLYRSKSLVRDLWK